MFTLGRHITLTKSDKHYTIYEIELLIVSMQRRHINCEIVHQFIRFADGPHTSDRDLDWL